MNKQYSFEFDAMGYGRKTSFEDMMGTTGKDKIMILTKKGKMLFFDEKDLRPMGENSKGIKLINLKKGDSVACCSIIDETLDSTQKLLLITKNGYGKRVDISNIKIQKRGGVGISVIDILKITGELVCASIIGEWGNVIVTSSKDNKIKIPIGGIPTLSFATNGCRLMILEKEEKVKSISKQI